jgi:uncharacterized protein (DUF427 family)
MPKAHWSGEVFAESPSTVVVDGHHYFPPQSVRAELLRPTTIRPDGAQSYALITFGRAHPDGAWSFTRASDDDRVRGRIAFGGAVSIED